MWCIFQFTHRGELTTLATKPWYDPNSGFCEEIRPLFCNYELFKRRQSFDRSLFVSQQVVFSAWVNPSVRRPLWRHHHTGSLGTLAGTARTLLSPQRQVLIGASSCTTPSARNPGRPGRGWRGCPTPIFNTALLWLAARWARLRSLARESVISSSENLARAQRRCHPAKKAGERTIPAWPARHSVQHKTTAC